MICTANDKREEKKKEMEFRVFRLPDATLGNNFLKNKIDNNNNNKKTLKIDILCIEEA